MEIIQNEPKKDKETILSTESTNNSSGKKETNDNSWRSMPTEVLLNNQFEENSADESVKEEMVDFVEELISAPVDRLGSMKQSSGFKFQNAPTRSRWQSAANHRSNTVHESSKSSNSSIFKSVVPPTTDRNGSQNAQMQHQLQMQQEQ
jgi:hypothetical protein